ncbi:hypothetical protein [Streptomyces sp. NPDC020362]|uniref:hypothetical protein n=1 Tax=unclassified Streptomyces TaxID=2593676 RepID=UPI000AC8E7FB
MPRPSDQAKRQHLLDQVRAYVIRNGLSDLSLRPPAGTLGTSDRMLLYCFGIKERMIPEALALDEGRPLLCARDALEAGSPPRGAAGMRRLLEDLWRNFRIPDQSATLASFGMHGEAVTIRRGGDRRCCARLLQLQCLLAGWRRGGDAERRAASLL